MQADKSQLIPLKRLHNVDSIIFLKIDDTLVKELSLDSGEVWAEQRILGKDILLVIRRKGDSKVS